MEKRSAVGLYGLETMGQALALKLLDKGISLSAWSRSPGTRSALAGAVEAARAAGGGLPGLTIPASLEDFLASLERPRKLILLLPPKAVDEVIQAILPQLEEGDILMDASSSHFADSLRRSAQALARGVQYVDLGISASAEDMRQGPVFMAGASPEAWAALAPILVAAAGQDRQGRAAAGRIGPVGCGHFARMAQGSIEYTDLEVLAETYHLMKSFIHLSAEEMRTVYSEWNKTEVSSRLLGLTADILGVREGDGLSLVDLVLDSPGPDSGAPGSAWAAEAVARAGLDFRSPLGLLGVAISARSLQALKDERVMASALLGGPKTAATGERQVLLENLRKALLATNIIALGQAFLLLRAGAKAQDWDLDLAGVARLWAASRSTGSVLLEIVEEAYQRDPGLASPLLDSRVKTLLDSALPGLRKVSGRAVEGGLPLPSFTSALGFYDSYRSTWLPANLIQALRDGLGGVGYERIDRPRGEIFHSEWK